ncbi:MAG: hypothetical protein QNK04_01375 [Myxococcota bacterium]|nr:hypothetical protein [Myxococcota bacterium]
MTSSCGGGAFTIPETRLTLCIVGGVGCDLEEGDAMLLEDKVAVNGGDYMA